jgi:hypothetical protein
MIVRSIHLHEVRERKIPLMIQALLTLLIIKQVFDPYNSPEMYYFFIGKKSNHKNYISILVTLVWLPIIIEYLISIFFNYWSGAAIYQVKHMIATLPFILILLSYHIDSYKNFYIKSFIVISILFLNFASIIQYFQYDLNKNWPDAGIFLEKNVGKNDGVILMPDLALSSLNTYYKPKFSSNKPVTFSVDPRFKSKTDDFLQEFYVKYIKKREKIFLIIREIGVKYGEFFKRDKLLYEKLLKEFDIEKVSYFSASPRIKVIELSKEKIEKTDEIEISLRIDLSKLYLLKYFSEIGLLDKINLNIMVGNSSEKLKTKLIDENNYIYEFKYKNSRFFPENLTFHTIIDSGIKNGIIAYYFYVGESGNFIFTKADDKRIITFIHPTMNDPFFKILRDLIILVIFIFLIFSLFLLCFKGERLD